MTHNDDGIMRNVVIGPNCLNRRIQLVTLENQRISFFPLVGNATLDQPFAYGYIYVEDYRSSDCINIGGKLITQGCLNSWRRLNLRTRGSIWFFPTDLTQESISGRIGGWIFTPDYNQAICAPVPPTPPPPAQLDVSGRWRTTLGRMTLRQTGNEITGTYFNRETGVYGTITGTLQNRRLRGRWTEQTRTGRLIFDFAANGNSFTGKYGRGNAEPNLTWNGARVRLEE